MRETPRPLDIREIPSENFQHFHALTEDIEEEYLTLSHLFVELCTGVGCLLLLSVIGMMIILVMPVQ
jgi:hypothetical protein